MPPWSAYPFIALMGLPLLFPVSADPLDKIPAERLMLWPIGKVQRLMLRLFSLALSPIFWLLLLLVAKKARWMGLLAFLAVAIAARGAAGFARRVPRWNILRWVPLLPGRLGGMVTNNIRGMLSVLDTWVAVLLSAIALAYRYGTAHPDPAALPILAMLTALALSTYAQSLFGLDFDDGMTLYRLLPLGPREILLAKDLAFLMVLLPLVLLVDPLAGLTFGLVSLAVGHHSSVLMRLPQRRWRFAGGRMLPVGALQLLASVGFGFAEVRRGVRFFGASVALYLLSLWFYGRAQAETGQ